MPLNDTPKLCECGCGQPTKMSSKTDNKYGWVKDQPLRFVNGHNRRVPLQDRFWEKVNKSGPIHPVLQTPCWLWTGTSNGSKAGYGLTSINGQTIFAHRASYELHYGAIPDGLWVLHKCDVRTCVNPDHLFLGTCKDNAIDRQSKGRSKGEFQEGTPRPLTQGESHHYAKFSEKQVSDIRQRRANGEAGATLAKEYGVTNGTISRIFLRKTWRHVI